MRTRRPLFLVLASTAVLTLANGSLSLLLPPYLRGLGLTATLIGAVVAASGAAALLTRLPAGLSYRRGRAVPLIVVGTVASSTAFVLIPAATHPLALAMLVAVDGAGFALTSTVAMAAVVDRRPPATRLASLLGWFTGSIGLGYSLAGFAAGSLGDAIGVPAAIRVMAFVPILAAGVMAVALRLLPTEDREAASPPLPARGRAWLRALPAGVWIAFFVSLYINLVNSAFHTFFPIYGLSIGLTLTQVGALSGIHGFMASIVRFGSGLLFLRLEYRRLLPFLVVASGGAVVMLAVPVGFVAFALTLAGLGLTRGVLRVAAGALAVEEAGASARDRGGASGIYLAGLDLGNFVGPVLGGIGAELVGIRGMFPLIGVLFPALYLVLSATIRARRQAAETRDAAPILRP